MVNPRAVDVEKGRQAPSVMAASDWQNLRLYLAMTYDRLQSEYGIGINRGALASGFRENEHRPGSEAFVNPHASWRGPKPPPLKEDLSRFVIEKKMPKLKRLLRERGLSVERLASQAGISKETVRKWVYTPNWASEATKAKLKALLTREEWEMVEGKV